MKNLNFIFRLMISSGILIILGTAGASDLERLGLSETLSQILLGAGLFFAGRLGLSLIKAKRAVLRRRVRRNKTITLRQVNAA